MNLDHDILRMFPTEESDSALTKNYVERPSRESPQYLSNETSKRRQASTENFTMESGELSRRLLVGLIHQRIVTVVKQDCRHCRATFHQAKHVSTSILHKTP